jgi:hypothetical protein
MLSARPDRASAPASGVSPFVSRVATAARHIEVTPGKPCVSREVRRRMGPLWDSPDLRAEAAAWCDLCPIASECLRAALELDIAYRHGEDPYGVTGVCGGVWFSPGTIPISIPHGPVSA